MKTQLPFILAIDTSCDDTSAAVTCGTVVVANVVASQVQLHKNYGGVFPTVAKQAHKENLPVVIKAALQNAQLTFADLAAVAVTQGPGLAPALEVGIAGAQKIAEDNNLKLIAVNHIEGHICAVLAEPRSQHLALETQYQKTLDQLKQQKFPVLGIVVSGGHTEFIRINKIGDYQRMGFTVDDAAGEALDKFGRMVDIGYPAGAVIEEFAHHGDAHKFTFPLPMTTSGNANLSFSGLKTAGRNLTEKLSSEKALTKQDIYDLCASFQYSVFRAITYKLSKVLGEQSYFGVWLGGGVSANIALRQAIRQTIRPFHLHLQLPYHKRLCIDNAAMIGVVAGFKLARGEWADQPQNVERLPRWEVDTAP